MTDIEMASEALTLVMDTGLPRLALLLTALGQSSAASECLLLQSRLLPVLRPPKVRRRRASKKQ